MIKGMLDTTVFFMRSIEDQEVVFWDYFFFIFSHISANFSIIGQPNFGREATL